MRTRFQSDALAASLYRVLLCASTCRGASSFMRRERVCAAFGERGDSSQAAIVSGVIGPNERGYIASRYVRLRQPLGMRVVIDGCANVARPLSGDCRLGLLLRAGRP
jgi:hypothetical protein